MTRLTTAVVAILLATAPTTSWAESADKDKFGAEFPGVFELSPEDVTATQRAPLNNIEKALALKAAKINADGPQDRGTGVELLRAEAEGKTLTFYYRFTRPLPADDPEGKRQREMTRGLCDDPQLIPIFNRGGTIKMVWRYRHGAIAHLLAANDKRCNPAY